MKPHHRIFFTQFAVALSLGALVSRLPDLQFKFSLSEGQLGLLLAVMSSGVLCGLTFSVAFIEKLGPRATAFVTVFGASLCFALIPWMPSALPTVPLFFIAGLFIGGFEVNANIETDRHEALLGYRIMSRAHGMWSVGFFITAFVAAGMRQAGVSMELHGLLVCAVIVTAGTIVFRGIEPAPPRHERDPEVSTKIAFPTFDLLPLCLIGAAPLLAEGASVDWSTIYMRDIFAAQPFVGGLGVTLFSLSIAAGRLCMDPVIDRLNPRQVARGLLALCAIGLVTIATAPHPVVALLGFCLTGIGCSSVYPLAISAAARRTDRPASVNVAALGQTTFVVFFAGPPLLGLLAEHLGVRFSYWAVVPVVLAALIMTRALTRSTAKLAEATE
jgi:MFS family permease